MWLTLNCSPEEFIKAGVSENMHLSRLFALKANHIGKRSQLSSITALGDARLEAKLTKVMLSFDLFIYCHFT
jgi:hypothetical protein